MKNRLSAMFLMGFFLSLFFNVDLVMANEIKLQNLGPAKIKSMVVKEFLNQCTSLKQVETVKDQQIGYHCHHSLPQYWSATEHRFFLSYESYMGTFKLEKSSERSCYVHVDADANEMIVKMNPIDGKLTLAEAQECLELIKENRNSVYGNKFELKLYFLSSAK